MTREEHDELQAVVDRMELAIRRLPVDSTVRSNLHIDCLLYRTDLGLAHVTEVTDTDPRLPRPSGPPTLTAV